MFASLIDKLKTSVPTYYELQYLPYWNHLWQDPRWSLPRDTILSQLLFCW